MWDIEKPISRRGFETELGMGVTSVGEGGWHKLSGGKNKGFEDVPGIATPMFGGLCLEIWELPAALEDAGAHGMVIGRPKEGKERGGMLPWGCEVVAVEVDSRVPPPRILREKSLESGRVSNGILSERFLLESDSNCCIDSSCKKWEKLFIQKPSINIWHR